MDWYEASTTVAAGVEDFVALQIQVAVEGFRKHLTVGYQGVKRFEAKGDVGEEIEVRTVG